MKRKYRKTRSLQRGYATIHRCAEERRTALDQTMVRQRFERCPSNQRCDRPEIFRNQYLNIVGSSNGSRLYERSLADFQPGI